MTKTYKDKDVPVFELKLKSKTFLNEAKNLIHRQFVLTLSKDANSDKSTNTGPFEGSA
mgnify:CR=1 FL=1